MAELHDLTALQQANALRTGEISSTELVEHYLDRIERHDESLGAFITVTPEVAREGAKAADERLQDGPDGLPTLFGVPTGLKDLNPSAGIRTTYASAVFAEFVPPADGAAVALIRNAGMPVLGKTNAPEFGPVCYTANALVGEARTPYDLTRSASGSSGGAAAAVAAGLMPLAHASDGAGSIRTPAATCGLVGFKPSRGVVSPSAHSWLAMSTEGPIARTVADAAVLLDLIAEPTAGDLYPAPAESGSFLDAVGRDPGRLRIARYADPGHDGVTVDPEVERAYAEATALLTGLGHEIVDIDHPMPAGRGSGLAEDVLLQMAALISAIVSTIPEPARPLLMPYTRYLAEHAARHSATDYALAQARLAQHASSCLTRLAPFDAVLTPTTLTPPVVCGALRNDEDGADEYARMGAWSTFTPMANLTGLPSVTLPLYQTAGGLPIGMMLTGRRNGDAALFSLAGQVEAVAPWHDRRPTVWTV